MLEYIRLYLRIFGTWYKSSYMGVYIVRYMRMYHRIIPMFLSRDGNGAGTGWVEPYPYPYSFSKIVPISIGY